MAANTLTQPTRRDATLAIQTLSGFIGKSQLSALGSACYRPEKQFFYEMLVSMADRVSTMPETYGQDGLGNQAIAYLHYFHGGCDWYITEKDADPDGDGQIQAFGTANLGHGPEMGYISIANLISNGVELDLYFTPATLESLTD